MFSKLAVPRSRDTYSDIAIAVWYPEEERMDCVVSHEYLGGSFTNGVGTPDGIFADATAGGYALTASVVTVTCGGMDHVYTIKKQYPSATDASKWAGNDVGKTGGVCGDPSLFESEYGNSVSNGSELLYCCHDTIKKTCYVYINTGEGVYPTKKGVKMLMMLGVGGSYAGMGSGDSAAVHTQASYKLCNDNHEGHPDYFDTCITNAEAAESPYVFVAHFDESNGDCSHIHFMGELPDEVSDAGSVVNAKSKINGPDGCPSHRVFYSPSNWDEASGMRVSTFAIHLRPAGIQFLNGFCAELRGLDATKNVEIKHSSDTADLSLGRYRIHIDASPVKQWPLRKQLPLRGQTGKA